MGREISLAPSSYSVSCCSLGWRFLGFRVGDVGYMVGD